MDQFPTIFLRRGRPASANKAVPENFKAEIQRCFLQAGGLKKNHIFYGVVYYFVSGYNPSIDADADNISKPVWDALNGYAYGDDKSVRLRLAGIIETSSNKGKLGYQSLDLTDVPTHIIKSISDLIEGNERRFLYVEIGCVKSSMYGFNLLASN